MEAEVLPTDATDKSVTWSVENGTGAATISGTGLLDGSGRRYVDGCGHFRRRTGDGRAGDHHQQPESRGTGN